MITPQKTETVSGLSVSYGYDTAGRIAAETSDDGTVSRTVAYRLDASGNTLAIQWPESTVFTAGYAYDSRGNVSEICHGTNINDTCATLPHYAQYTYDSLGRRDAATLGNGRTVDYAYHKDSMLKDLVHPDLIDVDGAGSAPLEDGHWEFEFTAANQMEWKEQPMAFVWRPGAGGIGAFDYVSTGLNQYDSVEAVAYGYDEGGKKKGNLVSDGTWTYTYDAENRLKTAAKTAGGTVSATYAYDPLDRRVSKTVNGVTTNYLWAGQNIIAEYSGSGTLLRRYVHGPGVDEPVAQVDYSPSAGTRYFHQDHLGTVVALTDAAGNLEDTYSYSTHGEIGEEGAEGSIWRFTGRQLDAETGLYYYRARMYSPRDGRFLQTDPAGDVDSLNLYQYALWDPIINKDPTGKFVPIIAAAASCAANPACRSSVAFAGGAVAGAIGNVATQVAAGGPVNFTEVGIAAATSGVAAVAVANGANPAAANGIAAATGSLASDVATGKVSDLQSGVAAGVKAGVMGVAGAVGGGLGAKAEDAIGVAVPTVGGRVTGSVVGSTVGETVTGIADPLATRAGVDAADVRPEAQRIQNQINHGVACQNQPQALGCQ